MLDDMTTTQASAATAISEDALNALFREARTHNGWAGQGVDDEQLRRLYDLMKWGPTSMNCSPARIIFLRSDAARERLKPHLSPGNVEKTMSAPVTAIIGTDYKFYEYLPRLFPHSPTAKSVFSDAADSRHAELTAFRNATLQGGYFIVAARAIGLDCGPMSGFDAEAVDREFWSGTSVRTNFICNLGHGDHSKLFGRLPRLEFDEVCRVV